MNSEAAVQMCYIKNGCFESFVQFSRKHPWGPVLIKLQKEDLYLFLYSLATWSFSYEFSEIC